ncbi:MAG: GNAT family N-acetyltransferase [Bacilli bacterium]
MNFEKIDITNVILNNDKVILRPFLETDLNDFYEYAKVSGVGEMAGWKHHSSIDESKMILDMFIKNKHTFAIVFKENNKVIGSIGIEDLSFYLFKEIRLFGNEIGYVLSKDYWGKGIMCNAVKLVINYLFNVASLDFVSISHFVWNEQSRAVINKLGFLYVRDSLYETRLGTSELSSNYVLINENKISIEEFKTKLREIE